MKKFKKGQPVLLVGNNNPFQGDEGIFKRYGVKREAEKLFVKVISTRRVHFFYAEEVVKND